jgi:hypothetical protein
MKILNYANLNAPATERGQITHLVGECMLHPAAGVDANGNPYTELDHCDSVDEAWDSIRDRRDDWDACIEEMEHLGSTGDTGIKAKLKSDAPVATKADAAAAKHFARRMVMWGWSSKRIRDLIGEYEKKILSRHEKRVKRKAARKKSKKK